MSKLFRRIYGVQHIFGSFFMLKLSILILHNLRVNNMFVFTVIKPAPTITLTLTADETSLLRIDFGVQRPENAAEGQNTILTEAAAQLREYFQGRRRQFALPLNPVGTDFQRQVWHALTQIPYGAACTYKELASATGRPKASRAVGSACHRNPLPIVIPCHRVIGSNGSLTGYAGGLALKAKLLKLEQAHPEKEI